jgi:hypothetical protein
LQSPERHTKDDWCELNTATLMNKDNYPMTKTTLLRAAAFSIAGLLTVGCANVGSKTVEVSGADDPFATDVKVSTYDYERPLLGANKMGTGDGFYRAYIDKELNKVIYQLYATITSGDWAFWDEVRYISNGERVERESVRVSGTPDCSKYGCILYEDMIVRFTRFELESLVVNENLEFRFYSSKQSGYSVVNMSSSELSAFLASIDAEREALSSGN